MPETRPIDQIRKEHPDKWLAIRVTARGEHQEPVEGELLAEANSHHELHFKNGSNPNVYETYSGERPQMAVVY